MSLFVKIGRVLFYLINFNQIVYNLFSSSEINNIICYISIIQQHISLRNSILEFIWISTISTKVSKIKKEKKTNNFSWSFSVRSKLISLYEIHNIWTKIWFSYVSCETKKLTRKLIKKCWYWRWVRYTVFLIVAYSMHIILLISKWMINHFSIKFEKRFWR